MPDAIPATHQPQPFQRRQVARLVAAAIAGALGIGYTLHDLDHDVLAAMARHLVTTAAIMLALWIAEIRQDRRLAQIEARLEKRLTRSEYWGLYSDVLTDLSGIDGEASTDSGRLPPRP